MSTGFEFEHITEVLPVKINYPFNCFMCVGFQMIESNK